MSKETEAELINWRNKDQEGDATDCDLHIHFEDFGKWQWPHIATEGIRVWELMLGEKIPEHSVASGIMHAIAAQAAISAFYSVATALCVNRDDLVNVMANWYDNQANLPPAVTPEQLLGLVRLEEESFRSKNEDDKKYASDYFHSFDSVDEKDIEADPEYAADIVNEKVMAIDIVIDAHFERSRRNNPDGHPNRDGFACHWLAANPDCYFDNVPEPVKEALREKYKRPDDVRIGQGKSYYL